MTTEKRKTKKAPDKKRGHKKTPANPKGAGAPSLFTPARVKKILGLLKDGNSRNVAAYATGIHPTTLCKWIREDQEFADQVHQVEALAETSAVNLIKRWGGANWQAAAWYLERKYPSRWGKRDRVPLDVPDFSELSDDELYAIANGTSPTGTSAAA